MEQNTTISAISGVIQLAVAPVFLLTGLAALLSVLSQRLGRVVDHARVIGGHISSAGRHNDTSALRADIGLLWRRIRLLNWAIRCAVTSALLVCLVVMCLFVADFAFASMDLLIPYLFVGAMLFAIGSLLLFLIEVSNSTNNLRQTLEHTLVENCSGDKEGSAQHPVELE